MLSEHERYYGLRMDALVSVCSRNTNVIMVCAWMPWSAYALGTRMLSWFGHGCFGQRMHSAHERYYGLGMDALVSVCSWNMNMVWAWMPWSAYALRTRTLLWFGHGCSGYRMLLEHERYCGLGMDALVSVCSRNTNDSKDAIRLVAAKTFSPNSYTLDPKIQPNDIGAELFALLRRSSSDALSFLFWRTSAWRPLKGLLAKFVGENN